MLQRCLNPRDPNWPRYGGAGVEVHEEWRDFWVFLQDVGRRPEGTTLDRIDPMGSYRPGNVRWADARVQRLNRRPTPRRETPAG
ncbi:hypothetical protein [Roseomonas chloroacetimidivorans]|uniref:hypothetical protein n=1 Tax=Roseomonas chloroacetimidivorans TaxID=1766656 RepID=UPI003C736DD1